MIALKNHDTRHFCGGYHLRWGGFLLRIAEPAVFLPVDQESLFLKSA